MCLTIFLSLYLGGSWLATYRPLQAHVDGLLLIATLLALTVLYLQSHAHVRGLVSFALPMLTLILTWAVCASAWTFRPFEIHSIWKTVHLTGVYLGTLFFVVAGTAGSMYLYVQRSLRHKAGLTGGRKLASLETLETLIVSTATGGFVLLTLGLITGFIVQASSYSSWGQMGWMFWSKVILAVTAWLSYALVMNVRHADLFRGSRAAWLSIVGLVLLLVTFCVAVALPADRTMAHEKSPPTDNQPAKKTPNMPTVTATAWLHPQIINRVRHHRMASGSTSRQEVA